MEFPHIEQMYSEIKPKGVEMIGLAGHSNLDTLRLLRDANGIKVPIGFVDHARDSSSVYGRYQSDWKIWYVLDHSGRVVFRGPYSAPKLRAALESLGVSWPR